MENEPQFEDVVNPTAAEITAWAYTPGAEQPMEDWDLILALTDKGLLLELVADPSCPQREILLSCLYIYTGDAVRARYRTSPERDLLAVLAQAEKYDEPWLTTWAKRTRALMAAPETFDYDAWCGEGLARSPVDPPAGDGHHQRQWRA
ncbi:hypothetical protein ACFWY9_03295 [Amycolatopsis sp. NPDC059027]|uniref:hypothetical protein n=1 Tax=Amycolatopsis sp. NPDC059027 TaxID=3346709 RepID=UPI00366DFC46